MQGLEFSCTRLQILARHKASRNLGLSHLFLRKGTVALSYFSQFSFRAQIKFKIHEILTTSLWHPKWHSHERILQKKKNQCLCSYKLCFPLYQLEHSKNHTNHTPNLMKVYIPFIYILPESLEWVLRFKKIGYLMVSPYLFLF